jgi:hypothetical protein
MLENATATDAKAQAQIINTVNGMIRNFITSPPSSFSHNLSGLNQIRKLTHLPHDTQFYFLDKIVLVLTESKISFGL